MNEPRAYDAYRVARRVREGCKHMPAEEERFVKPPIVSPDPT